MCQTPPGERCAADTREPAQATADAYRALYPTGPEIGPLEPPTRPVGGDSDA